MQKNMGGTDRAVRVVAALILVGLLLGGQITGVVGTILGIFAAVLLVTSALSFCPLYLPFKISTRKEIPTAAK
jgi:predicted PurR-regulated permease PerM